MDVEIKRKWVEALRGGKYKQHHHALANPDRSAHCCLGVLSVAVVGRLTYPDDDVFGLTERQRSQLIRMNDDDRKPFAEIADYIEANL